MEIQLVLLKTWLNALSVPVQIFFKTLDDAFIIDGVDMVSAAARLKVAS